MLKLTELPAHLPEPIDDGACNHLLHVSLPDLWLNSTQSTQVNLSRIQGWLVIYCYPMTGTPNTPLPDGWNAIPGARGCTPQSCAFRDVFNQFATLNTQVFGLSTQSTDTQLEAAERLHLPYALLSDEKLNFTRALGLPTFTVNNLVFNKRVTLIAYDGVIHHYFYPIFPPDKNASNVIEWLERHV